MSKSKVSGRTQIVKHLRNIDKQLAEHGKSMVQSLAYEAAAEARLHIMEQADTDFTQKYGPEAIASEVQAAKISDKSWGIIAPAKTKTHQMAENMYYAEYGAGILRDTRVVPAPEPKGEFITVSTDENTKRSWKTVQKDGSVIWSYNTTAKDMATTNGTKFPIKYLTPTGWQGITNRSKPLHYMAHARSWLRKNGAEKAKKSLQTILYRKRIERKESEEE